MALVTAASGIVPANTPDAATAHLFNGAPASNPAYWVSLEDITNMNFKPRGRVGFTLTVSPAGKAQVCNIYETSGDAKTDKLTCAVLMGRAEFLPAHDRLGSVVATRYSSEVNWSRDDRPMTRPDILALDLNVNRLPDGITSPATVSTEILVDEDGRVLDCDGDAGLPQQLESLACGSLMRSTAAPILDESGKPERSIVGAKVQFIVAPITKQ